MTPDQATHKILRTRFNKNRCFIFSFFYLFSQPTSTNFSTRLQSSRVFGLKNASENKTSSFKRVQATSNSFYQTLINTAPVLPSPQYHCTTRRTQPATLSPIIMRYLSLHVANFSVGLNSEASSPVCCCIFNT